MAASSSSSSRIPRSLHDVFLSFRGADTRNSYTSHLFEALKRHSLSTFRDNPNLRIGEEISSQLLKAIEESRLSIVVFSKNYAASKWCLDELVKIMECKRDFEQIVVPIFYDVDPSHVRAQLESYAQAFAKHEDRVKEGRLSMERVERWRAALTQAANLSGHDLQHGDESKLIKEVVEDIVQKLDRLYIHVADNPVGIESRVQELKAELKLELNDVRIIGIWGVGGIGKTTIAKDIFNCIHNKFEGSCFLADVSSTAKESFGVVKLQKQLLSNILGDDIFNLENYHRGIEVIKQKLCHLKVLVLDDVDHVEQLKMLAINRYFFGSGSRIIITTRNMTSLTSCQVNSVFSPKELNDDESLKLFSLNAFNTDYPEESYQRISNDIVSYAEGVPLVLVVLGSFLMGRSTAEWKSEFDKLKVIPNGDIQRKLKISFDSLDDKNQKLFLDIAFFFIGRDKDFTVKVLEDSGCFPESGIGELARRCLVRVETWGTLRMHDMLRDMGREIVRQQSLNELGERSRLWDKEEVLQVLRDCTGTKVLEGLSLQLPASNNEHVNTKAFANMSNLRLLHLNFLQRLSGTYIITSKNLKWLYWHGFPLAYIPAALYMENVVAIDLQYSKIKQIWKGPKRLDKLRFLILSHSYHLIETPDFSGLKNLEMLLLNDCTRLVNVHNSIGCLQKLLMLNMTNCINLRELPPSLFWLKSLEKLDFSGCSKLGELAESRGRLSMFWQWIAKRQEYIPIAMAPLHGLSFLQELNLAGCNIESIPSEIGSLVTLEYMDLSRNTFCSLPFSFSHLSCLSDLCLDLCVRLESLADLPKNLVDLTAKGCISLKSVSVGKDCPPILDFRNCPKLDGYDYSLIYPGGELPNDMHFQGVGPKRLLFVVPPCFGKKIVSFIIGAVVPFNTNIFEFKIVNETKRKTSSVDHDYVLFCQILPSLNVDEDHVWIINSPIFGPYFTLEGGDKIELSVCNLRFKIAKRFGLNYNSEAVVKRLGISLIYKDDDMYLESNIEQAN